ncbi:hypothetical protein, conserved [Eimeria maxima]|uniref:Uncharacterized protein n=1 Tax=Eimeria maxima TaxID=5804 RepID=U6M8W3_EIMMA|nr:hypothetical protein, conserved [Eimeria maxima]CDJ60471.1 hypothetical protein, conserved [Eimeria maxima]
MSMAISAAERRAPTTQKVRYIKRIQHVQACDGVGSATGAVSPTNAHCREAEGPRTFWWVDYKEVEAGEISLRSSGQGEQVPRHRHKKKGSSRKKLERRELHTQEQQQRPQQQQQRQRQQRYRNSVKLQKQRERSLTGGSDVEPLEPTQNQHVQQQQQRRHRNSLQMQLHREPSPSDGSTTDTSDEEVQQGQQERQRRHRYRNSVHLELRQNAWKSGLNSIPEDSDEEVQDQQPSLPVAMIPGKQQVQETPAQHSGGLQDVGELSESDWSDGDFSEGEEEAGAAAKGPAPFKGQISPHNLEGSPLPAPVLNRAVSKINRRYGQCGDTAREMTSAEEELIDSVIQRWEKSGFQAFKIEGMTVNSGEQKLILHNEALTANLVDIYLRALEVKYLPSSP